MTNTSAGRRTLVRSSIVGLLILGGCLNSEARKPNRNGYVERPEQRALMSERADPVFSREWMKTMLSLGATGECSASSPIYAWKDRGWGSNIMSKSSGGYDYSIVHSSSPHCAKSHKTLLPTVASFSSNTTVSSRNLTSAKNFAHAGNACHRDSKCRPS